MTTTQLQDLAGLIADSATATLMGYDEAGQEAPDSVYEWATREYTRSMQLQIIADELVGLTRYFRGPEVEGLLECQCQACRG